jgi:transposase
MSKVRCVGLDVHEESITIAIAEPGDGQVTVLRKIGHNLNELVKTLKGLEHSGATVRVAYEAGACGTGLWRRLREYGFDCVMVAPSRVPTQGRSKTDNEDAMRLARYLRSGDLVKAYVPDEECEALRSLTRAREDAVQAQQTARGQLRNFLVHQGLKYEAKTKWNKEHLAWVRGLRFAHPALALVRDDYLREVEAVEARITRLTKDLEVLAVQSSKKEVIEALQALRGIKLVTAATLAFEIGHFSRFASPRPMMSYFGLVPRESSSGERFARGSITKAGNSHVRRVLCECAWNYRFAGTSSAINKRRNAAPENIRAIAKKAQERLHDRYRALALRKKELNKVNIAISRELLGFVWAIGTEVEARTTMTP